MTLNDFAHMRDSRAFIDRDAQRCTFRQFQDYAHGRRGRIGIVIVFFRQESRCSAHKA
jgi:hypothetical protein